jgi:GrpB-like predicted nucleotidyltransferase (UPF0157 family)
VSDALVQVLDYDPAWLIRFADEAARVTTVMALWLAEPVQHIGSTSVPGLAAKPVVDMLVMVESLKDAPAIVDALATEGWLFWPDDPGRDYRLWFLRPRPEARTHHLQVLQRGAAHAVALLAFRNALRADERVRNAYAQLKRQLAEQHPRNRNAYTNAKSDFVAGVLREIGVEVPETDRLPE